MIPQNIVVPLDGSALAERAIPVARKLAVQTGSGIMLMTARWDDDPERAHAYLNKAARDHAPVGVLFVQDRDAARAISLVAQEDGTRLVCMTSHGRGSLRWAALGSVAEEVIRDAGQPVLVVGRHCSLDVTPFQTAIVAVDGSDAEDPVVPLAIDWARELDLSVRLVQVIHPLDVEDAEEPNKAVLAISDRMQDAGLPVDVIVLRSRLIGATVADYAATVTGGLVMMSSHSRTGIGRLALGSVPMSTVAMSPAPVLVVHRHSAPTD
jgi:nucleotide-binding universal stress UspA family protein